MATLTPQETKTFVENLIAEGKGDYGRLTYILSVLNAGRKLYHSDQNYLDTKLAHQIGLEEKIKVDEGVESKIKHLIASGKGDTGRLQFILESIQSGKRLYKSDQSYLEGKIGEKVNLEPSAKSQNTVDSLKSQVLLANERIANLETILHNKVHKLQDLKSEGVPKPAAARSAGTMPKGWNQSGGEPDSVHLENIQQQITLEQGKLDEEKIKADRLKIEQSKLMQIILDRKEFEKQVAIEQDRIQKQIEAERRTIQDQAKLMEQIKEQEAQLMRAKEERDSIAFQLQEEQLRLSGNIGKEKETLSQVRTEYEKITSEIKKEEIEIAKQVEQERLKLAEQARNAHKIMEEKEQLEIIRQEREQILKVTKSREQELAEQVKKEKADIAQQQKLLRMIARYEKYLELSKQKQALLTANINEHKARLRTASESLAQLKQDREIADKLTDDRGHIQKQIALAESEFKKIRKEKTDLEKQLKAYKATIAATKKQEMQKIKQLKQKKRVLERQIKTETTHVKEIAKKLSTKS